MDTPRRHSERGFSLLEAIVSVAILCGTVLALTSAMLGSTHDRSQLAAHAELADVATSVLTDLRVSAAYQPEVLDALAQSPAAAFTVTRAVANGATIRVVVRESLSRLSSSPGYEVTIVATGPDGHSETLQQTIAREAVAPGSIVTPEPLSTSAAPSIAYGGVFGGVPSANATPAARTTQPPVAAVPACIDSKSCWPRLEPGGTL